MTRLKRALMMKERYGWTKEAKKISTCSSNLRDNFSSTFYKLSVILMSFNLAASNRPRLKSNILKTTQIVDKRHTSISYSIFAMYFNCFLNPRANRHPTFHRPVQPNPPPFYVPSFLIAQLQICRNSLISIAFLSV
jgi:hypothetical protein